MSSRREFLEQSALLAAGALLLDKRPVSGRRQEKQLGVALVGLGSLSTYQLAPALLKTKNCRLTAIVTGTPSKAATWKAKYNIPDRSIYDYNTMDRMADNSDIDIVYVVTPNALHAEHTIKAARAGKHVLCEKPMEISVAKCEQMIAACKAAGRQLGVGYRCRFEPHHRELARIAREKALGDVRLIEAGFGFPIGDPAQWRLNKALSGGGPMMDVGIYALQSARMITGEEPLVVSAITTVTDPQKFRDIEESMSFQLKFPSGIIADCRTTYRANGVNRVSAFTDHASFGMEPAYNYSGNRGWRSDNTPLRFDQVDQFATELDDFAHCVRTNTPTSVPGEMGLQDVRLMMAAYESARTGRSIQI
jgi:predicted dehydrogenase